MTNSKSNDVLSQADLDDLLHINDILEQDENNSLVSELKTAILDSGKLELRQWQELRATLREVEALIPHIDLIIKLKREKS